MNITTITYYSIRNHVVPVCLFTLSCYLVYKKENPIKFITNFLGAELGKIAAWGESLTGMIFFTAVVPIPTIAILFITFYLMISMWGIGNIVWSFFHILDAIFEPVYWLKKLDPSFFEEKTRPRLEITVKTEQRIKEEAEAIKKKNIGTYGIAGVLILILAYGTYLALQVITAK